MIKRILWVLMLLSLLLLWGCGREIPNYTLETRETAEPATESVTDELPTIETAPKEYRQYATYPLEQNRVEGMEDCYYDTYSSLISYYDTELRRKVILCSQPNCTHSTENCVALLGNIINSYAVEGDLVYAVTDDSDKGGPIVFIERNMITGETRTLWDLTPPENFMRENMQFSIYKDVAFMTFLEYELQWNDNGTSYQKDPAQYSYEIDLTTGQRELLLKGEIPAMEGFGFMGDEILPRGCTENYLLIMDVEYHEDVLLSPEEYLKENPQGDWGRYIVEEFQTTSHYSLNRKTGERKRICGDYREAGMTDVSCIRDGKLAFLRDNKVFLYDCYSGEETSCFEQENIAILRCFDGRIFFNTKTVGEDGGVLWRKYWYDIQTGEKREYDQGADSAGFSIHGETINYFYGIGPGGSRMISKQDFYNENYDGAF